MVRIGAVVVDLDVILNQRPKSNLVLGDRRFESCGLVMRGIDGNHEQRIGRGDVPKALQSLGPNMAQGKGPGADDT